MVRYSLIEESIVYGKRGVIMECTSNKTALNLIRICYNCHDNVWITTLPSGSYIFLEVRE